MNKYVGTGNFIMSVLLITVFIFISAVFTPYSVAEEAKHISPDRLFSRGSDYYEKGDYDNAIKEYEKILSEGYESGQLYFNLGNSYYRSGKIGNAILNYERAALMIPRDADLNKNHKFLRTKIKGRIISEKSIWDWYPLKVYYKSFTVNEMTVIASGAFILLLVLILLMSTRTSGKKYYVVIVSVMLLFFIALNITIIWHKIDRHGKDGIVVVPRTEVFYGPFESATKFFSLQEGMKARVLNEKEDWYKVRSNDGKTGWIKKDTFKII